MQVVYDNFDIVNSSPNAKASTHSLAINVMQPTCDNHQAHDATIRLLRHEISQAIQENICEQSSVYYGQIVLTGKKYPQNACAFRMLVEELRRPIFATHHPDCMENLQEALYALETQSRASMLWVDCLIKPVLTILKYTRTERESDWPLHV